MRLYWLATPLFCTMFLIPGPMHIASAQRPSDSAEQARYQDDWAVGDPAKLGLDSNALREHRALCQRSGADACVIVYRGVLVQEWYGPAYSEPMMAMSSTKSVTGLLVGLLASDSKLSVDDRVSRYIPQWRAGDSAGVTIRHLLTMTSGLPDDRGRSPNVGLVTNKDSLVFGLPLPNNPGSAWAYSNNGAYLLSPLIRAAAGESLERYAQRRLFGPLGMKHSRFHEYPEGQPWTHGDMETTPRDLARIGQVMLQGGQWRGEQVIPQSWARESTQSSQNLKRDYGLLWWLDVPGGYAARGYLDTNIYVMTSMDLVVVRMQSKPVTGAAPYERDALRIWQQLTRR